MKQKSVTAVSYATFAGAIALTAFLCVSFQGQFAANGNISWLLIGAERLLAGQNMVDHIYEPNPPLSLLIYIPHVLFSHLTHLPLTIGAFWVTAFLSLLSTLATGLTIRHYSFLNRAEKLSLTACYLVAITLSTSFFFSEREHILILGLAPFLLVQFALMEKIKLPKLLQAIILLLGAIAVLIKPHYGLAPTIFLIARLIKHKQTNPLKLWDFIVLSTITLTYIAIIAIFFSDYAQTILPDVLTYYIGTSQNYAVILQASMLQATLFLCTFLAEALLFTDLKSEKRKLTLFLYASTLLCLIPYYVQMKGYYNHLIPANSLFLIALSTSLIFRMEKATIILPFLGILGATNIIAPINSAAPTHKEIKERPLTKFLEETCTQPCHFYAFHTDQEIMPTTAAEMSYTYASRFSTVWPVIGLLEQKDTQKAKQDKERYARYILEDLKYDKPSVLLISKETKLLDFMEFFGSYEPLKNYIVAKYKKQPEILSFDRAPYLKGTTLNTPYTLNYDVFFLKTNKDEAE